MDIKLLQETPPWDWPENSAEIFKKTLLDPRAREEDRVIAAELAGNMVAINDDLAAALLSTIANTADPEALRAQAAVSLGPALEQGSITEFDDPEDVPVSEEMFFTIQATLAKLFADESLPKLVRRRIFEASVRAPEEWHKPAILTAYNSGDRDWVLTAVFAMGHVKGFEPQILEALKNPDPEIHFEAVDAAGTWEIDAAYDHVLALVKNASTPKPLIFAAIEAVAAIRPKDAGEALHDCLESDDEEIQEVANDAWGMASGIEEDWDDEDDEDSDDEDSEDEEWVN